MSSPPNHPSIDALLGESEWAWRLARSLVGDSSAADDVVQDAIKSAVERPPDFTAEGNTPRGWLSTVIRGLVAKRFRGEQRRNVREQWSAKVEALPPAERMLEREEQRRHLIESVLGLSEPYRDVLLLRYFEDLTPTEIAARLKCPLKTVKSRLTRAHEQLRERLQSKRDEHGLDALSALAIWIPVAKPLITLGAGAKLAAGLALFFACATALWFLWPADETSASVPLPAIEMFAATKAEPSSRVEESEREVATPVSAPPVEPLEHGQRVRVLFDRTRAPAVGATVRWRAVEAGGARGPQLAATTDAAGELEFERPAGQLELEAAWPGWFAETRLRDSDVAPRELVLVPDGDLQVQVRFASGAPAAGFEVAVSRGGSSRASIATEQTDPSGLVVFEHFRARQFASGTDDGLVWIAPLAPVLQRALHFERVTNWPRAPIVLTIPDGASLRVHVVDAAGAPLLEPARLAIIVPASSDVTASHVDVRDGEALVQGIEPGITLSLLVQPAVRSAQSGSGVPVDAPRAAGESAEVTLKFANQTPLISGRVLDPRGTPLAGARLDIVAREHFDQPWDPGRSTFRTDDSGRFEGATTRIEAEAPIDAKLLFRTEDGRLEGRIDFGAPLAPGAPTYVGDVQLAPVPVLVSGLVVDDEGRPLANATVDLLTRPAGSTERCTKDAPRSVRSDAVGQFELRAGITTGELQLVARLGGHVDSVPRDVQIGESSVVLVLPRQVQVAGRVLASNPNVLDALELECAGTKVQPALDGTFRLVVAGDVAGANLRVLLQGHEQPLVELANLQGADDPRLASIDVTELAHALVATLVDDATGEPIPRAEYLWSTDTAKRSLQSGRGCVGAVVAGTRADFVVNAPGYPEQRFADVLHGDVLRLRR
ncbi:MAG: sigma-70 family RNA polymerase sigma factor [Planctomycetota bacterium]|nr:sigma-70 family RNA polymerase sigma factor [Planctomycetota bacterium]